MAANLENTIQEKVKALPVEKQQRVLSLVEEMLSETNGVQVRVSGRPLWEIAEEISSQVRLKNGRNCLLMALSNTTTTSMARRRETTTKEAPCPRPSPTPSTGSLS